MNGWGSGARGGTVLTRARRASVGLVASHNPSRLQDLARLIEDEGYGGLWVADEALYRNVYVALALAATATSTLRIGTAVTNPFTRHPALTAAAIATVDEVSNGRAVLGLGAGGSAVAALGIARQHPALALKEATVLIQRLTAGDRVDVRGRVFSFSGALNFAAARRVPVLIAARGLKSLRVAGEVADGAIIGGLVDESAVGACIQTITEGAQQAGRFLEGFQRVAWVYTACSEDLEAAESAVRRVVALSVIASRPVVRDLRLPVPPPLQKYLDAKGWAFRPDVVDEAAAMVDRRLLDVFSVAGSARTCEERLGTLFAQGIDELGLLIHAVHGQSLDEAINRYATILRSLGAIGG
jgi:5,10-methylenetetrahydromethanopterin reductase